MLVGAADQAEDFLRTWTEEYPDDLDGWFLRALDRSTAGKDEQRLVGNNLVRLAPDLGLGHVMLAMSVPDPGAASEAVAAQARARAHLPELSQIGLPVPDAKVLPLPAKPAPPRSPAPASIDFLKRQIVSAYATDDLRRISLDARSWTQLDPEDPLAWRALALSNLVLGHADRAKDAARHLLDLTPRDRSAQGVVVEADTGLTPLAHVPASDVDPHQVDECWARALATGPPDQREAALRELISIAPRVRYGYAELSLLLARGDDLNGALEVAEEGLRQAPTAGLPHRSNLPDAPSTWTPPPRWTGAVAGQCDRAWPDPDAAGDWVGLLGPAQAWAQLDPGAVLPLVMLSEACRHLGRTDQASEALRRARALEPDNRALRRATRMDALRRLDAAGDYHHPGPAARVTIWLALCLVSSAVFAVLDGPPAKPFAVGLMTLPVVGAILLYRAVPDDSTLRGFVGGLPFLVRTGSLVAGLVTALLLVVGLAGAS